MSESSLGHTAHEVRIAPDARVSDAILSTILSIAADAIITMDDSMRIVHFNRGAEQIFGYTAEQAIGMPLEELLPPRFRGVHGRHVREFAAGGVPARRMGERSEIFGLRRNGQEFPAEASISKLALATGNLYTVVLRDISYRKRIEGQQQFLVEAGALLAHSLDYEATVRTAAELPVPHMADLCILDLVEDDRLRRVVSRNVAPEIAPQVQRLGELALTWDSPSRVIDVLRTRKPELVSEITTEWIEAHAEVAEQVERTRDIGLHSLIIVPLTAREDVLGAMTVGLTRAHRRYDGADVQVAQDLAIRVALALDNARLYGEARRATRARDEVLGVVSHDLRNPLSAITMCTRVLLDRLGGDEAGRELLTTIYDSASWMNRLIQDLLDVSNIEAGRLSVERHPVNPAALVERSTDMLQREAADRQIGLHVELPSSPLPPVSADEERMVQVLTNLIGNALKFTAAGGTVKVGAFRRDGEVVLVVQDTGIGIPPEHLPHVFERGWHARRNARKRGSGLGLAIAKGIVEAHGGRIWVESTLGVGSTFSLTVPLWSRSDADALSD